MHTHVCVCVCARVCVCVEREKELTFVNEPLRLWFCGASILCSSRMVTLICREANFTRNETGGSCCWMRRIQLWKITPGGEWSSICHSCGLHQSQHIQSALYLSSLKVDRVSHTMWSLTQQVWLNLEIDGEINSLLKNRATFWGSIKTYSLSFPK